MKRAAFAAALAALACAPAAFARDGASEAMPAFSSLPEGHVAFVPPVKNRPARLGASEKVPGFYTMTIPRTQPGDHYAYLVADPQELEALKNRKSKKRPAPSASGVCFSDGERARAMRASFSPDPAAAAEKEVVEWEGGGDERVTLRYSADERPSRRKNPVATHGVYAIHAERFVAGEGGKASLEMTDAWVDALTLGARLIGKSTLSLVHVASGPSGIEIYAARDKDRVEVVVTPAKPPLPADLAAQATPQLGNVARLFAEHSQNRNTSSSCGHLRLSLHLERGTADMAVVQTTALLPALEKEGGPEAEAAQRTNVKREAAISNEFLAMQQAAMAIQAMRRRPVKISVSTSELSGDAQPVLSVAMGWAGKEERSF